MDIRNRAIHELLGVEEPDVLIHLAFVLNPVHDEQTMYDIDVNGTQNVLEAASAAGVGHVLVTSSTTAYGAFADNPVPLTEEDTVRGAPDFSYARDKAESDRLCQLWALQHPERVMTIVRPCIVFGPDVDNYIVRLWLKQPFRADLGMGDPPLQFVHVDDVAEALIALLEGRHAGAYNVAGDGLMTNRECAELIGTPIRKMPLWLYRRLARVMWKLRQSEVPPGGIEFALHSWLLSNEKLKRTTGWGPKHTSRETFEITMRTHGKLPPVEPVGTEFPAATIAA